MIYSVNFLDMTEKLNPLAVCKYLEQTDWSSFSIKRKDVRVYQMTKDDDFRQVTVPMEKSLIDYKRAMYAVVQNLAETEGKSVEQVMLYLLNPNTDILKIRLDKKDVEAGNIMFDDAITLFDNAKKLLAATASDIINQKKIHYGRGDERVQKFLSQCRFGQTEIGSYVVSVVCPFAELSETEGYKQLNIFADEERCAHSLTRMVTNKLMTDIVHVKQQIDAGKEGNLVAEKGISANFLEALNGLNLHSENTAVEFTTEWSPVVKTNRCAYNHVRMTNDYYQPIAAVIDRIKGDTKQKTEIVGRIKKLSADPSVSARKGGTVVIIYVAENDKARPATVKLSKEDYENAVEAHKHGKSVKAVGELKKQGNKYSMDNCLFSVID